MISRPRTLFVLFGILLAGCGREKSTNAPVILISIDTLRADHLTAYGAKLVDTSAIDRLARDGIVFENAYSHVPLTLPSHVTILTGRLPFENGVRSNIGYKLDHDVQSSLPRLLKQRGYATGGAVSAYVIRGETGIGPLFDFYDDSMEVWESATLGAIQRRGDETSRVALNWVDRVRDKPFFLFLHLFEPHTPYAPVEPFRSKYANPYDGEIATADAIVGRFFAELEKRGLYDQSLIILCADHGEGLNDHGEAEHGVLLYREVLHVPLIVKLPGQKLGGKRVAAPAQLVDILPTITDVVGAPTPNGLPGVSLVAEGRNANRTIYSETLYPRLHLGWSQLRSLTNARDHYIESPAPELYDIAKDPRETRNIREEQRRDARALAEGLSKIPLNLRAQKPADAEEMARLAALGYLSGAASNTSGPLKNPRDHIQVLARIQQTFVLNQEGRYRESIELCRQILREYPDLVDVYMQLAGDLRRLGRLKEALDAYREAIRRSPQLVDSVALEIAKLELDLGDVKAAELNTRQAMKLDPLEAHLILAALAERRSDFAGAEREARLALGPEDRPRVPALIFLARDLAEQKKLDEALSVVNRATARVGEEGAHPVPTLSSTRGDVLARMGRNDEAEAAFREEIKNFPTTTDAYVKLALLLAAEHRFTEIEPTLEAMVKASPTPATYLLAARAMHDFGNEAASRAFRSRAERLTR
ncbi:MAG: tetratricopeptide repeat protein [Acidobacteriota bacterium]|nr:tetratricopeptide repeat protein [Acidobacteriota bacterium]